MEQVRMGQMEEKEGYMKQTATGRTVEKDLQRQVSSQGNIWKSRCEITYRDKSKFNRFEEVGCEGVKSIDVSG